ncbi:ATP phosphoribosyltransferase [bacterium]|nr:ATP phosphoribosyltransferase [bacterium]
MENMLKIAIPNKGRLSEKIYDLLNKAGLNLDSKDDRELSVTTSDGKFSVIFVRTQDIPRFLDAKAADIGFTGLDIVEEEGVEVDVVKQFSFGKCDMVVAVKEKDSYQSSEDLPEHFNIATSFPNIAKRYFEKIGKTVNIIEISGAVEITPSLGLSDVVVDITSTGTTLKQNGLRVIDKILSSSTVLIARKNLNEEKAKKLDSFLVAINSVLDAREKKYLMAHVPKNNLDKIKEILPGLSSPTLTTLYGDNENVVIHVVINKNEVFESIEKLKTLGGKGILILSVDQMVR